MERGLHALLEDGAPSASLGRLEAPAAPLRAPERRPSRSEARCGPRSSPPSASASKAAPPFHRQLYLLLFALLDAMRASALHDRLTAPAVAFNDSFAAGYQDWLRQCMMPGGCGQPAG